MERRLPDGPTMAAAAFSVLVWGATPVVTRFVVGVLDPLSVGYLRSIAGALIAVPIILILGLSPPRGAGWRNLVIASGGGYVIFPMLFSIGLGWTTAANAALILATLPIFTGLAAGIVERRLPGRRWWLGVALAVAGTAILIAETGGRPGEQASFWGDMILLVGCVAAGCGYVGGARLARQIGTLPTTLWATAIGGAALSPFLALADFGALAQAPASGWLSIAYLAGLSTILAYISWYWALGRGGVARVATAQYVQPLVTIGLAAVFLGESLTLMGGVAALVILTGVWVAQRG